VWPILKIDSGKLRRVFASLKAPMLYSSNDFAACGASFFNTVRSGLIAVAGVIPAIICSVESLSTS
jgi:hypothetical protein